jgi:hypothetical protein
MKGSGRDQNDALSLNLLGGIYSYLSGIYEHIYHSLSKQK